MIDIWRVRNPSSTRFSFRKKQFSGFIQTRLDYIFISNSIQESVQNTDVLPSFCSDHSSLLLSYKKLPHPNLGENFWKFNCSLIHDEKNIENIINSFEPDFIYQMKWEYLKYEIRKFTISFSKYKNKLMREKKLNLERKLKLLEAKLNCNEAEDEYNVCKENLNVIYYEIATGINLARNLIIFP